MSPRPAIVRQVKSRVRSHDMSLTPCGRKNQTAASLRAVQKAGYREVGRIPGRYWKRGAYRESIQLAADCESWQP